MEKFLQFDISDVFNEINAPVLVIDAEDIIFSNSFFRNNYKAKSDLWKVFFQEILIQETLDQYFITGEVPKACFLKSFQSISGGFDQYEWTFVNLPSSYSSKFLIVRGHAFKNNDFESRSHKASISEKPIYEELKYLSSIISNSHDLIVIVDSDGYYKFVSPSVCRKFDVPASRILGKNYQELIDLGILEVLNCDFNEIAQSKENINVDFCIHRPDGTTVYLESFAKNLLDDPEINGILFNSRDITEFIETDKAFKRMNQIEHLISQISSHIIKSPVEVEEHFHNALIRLNSFLNTKKSHVFIIDQETQNFDSITSIKFLVDPLKTVEEEAFQRSISANKKTLINGTVELIKVEEEEHLLIPLISTFQFIGVIALVIESIEYTFQEIQRFKKIGDILAVLYERSALNLKIERNENLLTTTELLSKSGSWRYHASTNCFFISQGLAKMFDLEEHSLRLDFSLFLSKITTSTQDRFVENLREVIESGGKKSGEFQLEYESDKLFFISYEIESKINPLNHNIEVYGFCTDHTHKHFAEKQLKLQSQILTQVSDPIIVTTPEFEIMYMNEASAELCKVAGADTTGAALCDFIKFSSQNDAQYKSEIARLQVGESWQRELYLEMNGNRELPFDLSIKAIDLPSKDSFGYSFVLRDLTQRYESEKVSRQTQIIVENSPLVLFSLHNEGSNLILYISENISQFGYAAASLIGTSFLDLIHKDDVDEVLENYMNAISRGSVYSGEYRIKNKEGGYSWVEEKTRRMVNDFDATVTHEGFIQDITDRKKLEIFNEEKENQYRILAANIPGASVFLLDKNRRFIIAEGANFNHWNIDSKDFEGKHVSEFSLTDSSHVNQLLDKVYNDHEIVETEFEMAGRHYERSIRPIVENGTVELVLSVIRDIHVQKKATENLLASEEKYRALVEESTEIIFSISEKMEINFVSPNVYQHLDYTADEIIGTSLLNYLNPEDLDVLESYMLTNDFLDTTQYLEFRIRHKDGSYRIFSSNGRMVAENGVNQYYTGIARDISKLKHTQKELVKAKENAEHASLAKSQFLSIMSHEIRTPLNAVIGMTHFLMNDNPRPDQLKDLETLQFSADNLLGLINDILDYNKIDLKKVELETLPFDLKNLIKNTTHTHSFQAMEKGLKLTLDIDENIPDRVLGDSLRLSQVINNLLSNAIKFTEKGKVDIKLELKSKTQEDCTIRFSFKDTGIGIPQTKLNSIFDAFTQAYSSTTRKFGGTGLGLAIVKKLVELHDSKIHLTSKVGQGSTLEFVITFPNCITNGENEGFCIKEKSSKSLTQASILVAEDNVINQVLVNRFLKKWGVRNVILASDGQEALEKFESNDVDLVLLDVEMPIKDGFYVADKIRKSSDPVKANLPIIIFSASTLDEVQEAMDEMKINDFVPKPFSPEVLHGKLTRYLNQK